LLKVFDLFIFFCFLYSLFAALQSSAFGDVISFLGFVGFLSFRAFVEIFHLILAALELSFIGTHLTWDLSQGLLYLLKGTL